MTYPEPRYRGDTGLVNAVLRTSSAEPEIRFPSGGAAHYLATGRLTDGRFGLYRWDMAEQAGGAAPHFHRSIAEAFFVLSGTVRLFDGSEWRDGGPGDFLYVPEGGIHGFRNAAGPASMLILFAPGAPREDYFETLDRLARGRSMTDEERAEFFVRHDTYWV